MKYIMKDKELSGFQSIVELVPTILFIGAMASAFKGIKKTFRYYYKTPSAQEHEDWMAALWKVYGRQQPPHYVAD